MSDLPDPILPSDREYLLARRQGLLIELGAIERRLKLPRSVIPVHQRREEMHDAITDRGSSPRPERDRPAQAE